VTGGTAEAVSGGVPESASQQAVAIDVVLEGQESVSDRADTADIGPVEPETAVDADSSGVAATALEAATEVADEPSAAFSADEATINNGVPTDSAPVVAGSTIEGDAVSAEIAANVAAPAEADGAPAMIEVWRPGGRSADRRPRHDRNRHRRQQARPDGPQPATADKETSEGAQGRERYGRGRRGQSAGRAAESAPGGNERESREGKGGRPRERFKDKDRDRDQDKGRVQGSRKGGREGRSDAGPSHRPYASSAPREREQSIDPNSPFAKLAALKEQLAGRKD
jgi:ATP-dependent RNA helicase SUPV3L1/SUV3